jgi:hypothetical protein
MKNKPQFKTDGYGGCLVWIILLLMIGCNSVRKAAKIFDKHEPDAAIYCAVKFPVRDTIIQGDTVTTTDTLWGMELVHDTTVNKTMDTVTIHITKPVTVTRTLTIHDTVYRENTARVTVLQNANSELSRNVADLTEQRDNLQAFKDRMRGKVHIPWWWLLVAAIIGGVAIKFRKLIPF